MPGTVVKKNPLFDGTGTSKMRYYTSSRDDRAGKARSSPRYNCRDQQFTVNSWSPWASKSAYMYAPESAQGSQTGIRPQYMYKQYSQSSERNQLPGYQSHVYRGQLDAYF